jgi:hypothetical protein
MAFSNTVVFPTPGLPVKSNKRFFNGLPLNQNSNIVLINDFSTIMTEEKPNHERK